MGFSLFHKNSHKDYLRFCVQVFSKHEDMLGYASNEFFKLYKEHELFDVDNAKTILPEMMKYVNIVMYLSLQQCWKPFGEAEAKVALDFFETTDIFIRKNIPSKYSTQKILSRMNDYDSVVRNQVKFYGQSLYLALDDDMLSNHKSDAFGRCAILFTDFLYFSRLLKDFASMEDMSAVMLTDIFSAMDSNLISLKTLEISFKIIKKVQTILFSINR